MGESDTDEALMLRLRSGDRNAFDALFARYRQPVWGFFQRRLVNTGLAEELAQDTFVVVLQASARWEPRGSFRSYLFGIAFNLLAAARRRARVEGSSLELVVDPPAPGSDPDDVIWVKQALLALDEQQREILMLREYEQLSYDDIATLLAIPLNTVRSRLFRARESLKARLVGSTGARGAHR